MAYIDRDKLSEMIKARAEMLVDGKQAFYYIANWLDKLPTADVVEVVRCKDCVYWQNKNSKGTQGICLCGEKDMNYGGEFYPFANDFCSYGKRKEAD